MCMVCWTRLPAIFQSLANCCLPAWKELEATGVSEALNSVTNVFFECGCVTPETHRESGRRLNWVISRKKEVLIIASVRFHKHGPWERGGEIERGRDGLSVLINGRPLKEIINSTAHPYTLPSAFHIARLARAFISKRSIPLSPQRPKE